jgi:hypothetical protein
MQLLAILLSLLLKAYNSRAKNSMDANISRNASNSRDARHVVKTSCRKAVTSSRVGSEKNLATTELQGYQQQ